MSALVNVTINLDKLPRQKFVKGKKGTYYTFTLSVGDQTNAFGQNVSVFDAQTKEQVSAKAERNYLGNGNVFWTDGTCVKAEPKEDSKPKVEEQIDDLPF